MKVSKEEIRERYEALTNEELARLYFEGNLTAIATTVLQQVLDQRGVDISELQQLTEETSYSEKVPLGSVTDSNYRDEVTSVEKIDFRHTLTVLAVILLIPVFGFLVALYIITDLNNNLQPQRINNVISLCAQTHVLEELGDYNLTEEMEFCSQVSHIVLLSDVSVVAGLIGLLIPTIYWLAVHFVGENRIKLARVFPPISRASVLLITVLVFLHGAILTYGFYIAETYTTGSIHFVILGSIALGSLYGGIRLIRNALNIASSITLTTIGKRLTPEDAPITFKFIEDIVQELNAKPPTNIVVGLDPTFYVTSGRVILVGEDEPMEGETLFISSTLSRILTKEELRGVIGHEFGHFRGDDTIYSMKFAPVYAGLGGSLEALASTEDEGFFSQLARYPAFILLRYLWVQFSTCENRIRRGRELEADKSGVVAASALSLASSLLKIAIFTEHWPVVVDEFVQCLKVGSKINNIGLVFRDSVKYDAMPDNPHEMIMDALDHEIPHPTDSHPTLRTRFSSLQILPEGLPGELLRIPTDPASDLIDNCDAIDQENTKLLASMFFEEGTLLSRNEESRDYRFLSMIYQLAAIVLSLDGGPIRQEVKAAEVAGKNLFNNFDVLDFRAWLERKEPLSDAVKFALTMKNDLDSEEKGKVLQYLESICQSDETSNISKNVFLEQIIFALDIHNSDEKQYP